MTYQNYFFAEKWQGENRKDCISTVGIKEVMINNERLWV